MTDVLGRYRLLERIGLGGMAEVFLARVIDGDGTFYVIKRMLPHLAAQREFVAMFLDEARIGRRLTHQNIVAVVDFGEVGGSCFTVLEHVDGVDLRVLVRRLQRQAQTLPGEPIHRGDALAPTLPFHHTAWLLSQVARGLHFAHRAEDPATHEPLGVVHRDVSPSNILISRSGDVRVADFGVARSNVQSVRTATGGIKGKIAYMAPEQLDAAANLDSRADVYSLGVILWELLTGRRFHEGRNDVQIVTAVSRSTPPSPAVKNPLAPPELSELALRCVATSPSARPHSALVVAEELERFAVAHGGGDAPFRSWVANTRTVFDSPPAQTSGGGPWPEPDGESTATTSDATEFLGDASTLVRPAVAGQLRRVAEGSGSVRRPVPKAADRPREVVLYVEDEPENREVAALRMRRNYELLLAENDVQACELLRTRGHELSAVLMDIQLKGSSLNGIELVQLIRGTLQEQKKPPHARGIEPRDVPIIFVTAYGARYSEAELMAAGAQKLVTKPVNFVELTLALVDVHLKKAMTAGV